ncbi:MAG: GNAT family protein [Nocardioides sp.]|uniref:GNAT family N-acetyltransferase n=1 Tax=Nocardioides sp. TaxID=35761 RepID=UPI00326564DC
MTRTNDFGQPIGVPVPDWTPRPATAPEVLVGPRVRLERLRPDHAATLHGPMVLESSPRIWTYYPYPDLTEPSAFDAYVATLLSLPAAWPMAVLTPDGVGRGVACYLRMDPANGSVEVGGIVYAESLQRTAATTEAMYLMLAHAFDDLGYRRFEWKCDSLNEPSRLAAVRLGFTYEGRFRNAMVYQGRNRDTDWFSITDAEWPAVKAALEAWLAPDNFSTDGDQLRSLADCR